MNKKILYSLLIFVTFACRPVIAIGWNELLFLFVVIAALLGPPLYKFLRRVEKFWKHRLKDK